MALPNYAAIITLDFALNGEPAVDVAGKSLGTVSLDYALNGEPFVAQAENSGTSPDGNAHPSGVSMTSAVGTATANGGGVSGTASPSGVSMTSAVGTATASAVSYYIQLDTNSTVQSWGGFVNSASWSHTVHSGNNRILIVQLALPVLGGSITSFTYGGNTLTQGQTYSPGGGVVPIQVWYLVNPPVGTATVQITFTSGQLQGGYAVSTSWFNVNQTTPIDSTGTATGTSTNPSGSITTVSDQALILGVCTSSNNPAPTPNTFSNLGTANSAYSFDYLQTLTAGTFTDNYTKGTSSTWAVALIALVPQLDGNATPTGRSMASTVGSATVTGFANRTVSGLSLTSAVGLPVPSGSANVTPSGVLVTVALGTVTPFTFVAAYPNGVTITAAQNAPSPIGTAVVTPMGQTITAAQHAPTPSGAANVTPDGQSAALSVGTATILGITNIFVVGVNSVLNVGTANTSGDANITPSGQLITSVIGTPIPTGTANVLVTGVEAIFAVGVPTIQVFLIAFELMSYDAIGVQSLMATDSMEIDALEATDKISIDQLSATDSLGLDDIIAEDN